MWHFARQKHNDEADPAPVTVVRPHSSLLTRDTAIEIVHDIAAVEAKHHVVVDLSHISEWDTAGAAVLADLAEASNGRVELDGLDRVGQTVLGYIDSATDAQPEPIIVTELRVIAVMRPPALDSMAGTALEDALVALSENVSTIVVDLTDIDHLDGGAMQSLSFASSLASLRGLDMMVVNANEAVARVLRRAGLSDRTYIAPPQID